MRGGTLKIACVKSQFNIDGLVQDCSNSIANALELLQSCSKPLIYFGIVYNKYSKCGDAGTWNHASLAETLIYPFSFFMYSLDDFLLYVLQLRLKYTVKLLIWGAPKPKTLMFLLLSCCCLWPSHWSQVWRREWRCSWSSADRRCSNYFWVINNFIAQQCASYIRDLTVFSDFSILPYCVSPVFAIIHKSESMKFSCESPTTTCTVKPYYAICAV